MRYRREIDGLRALAVLPVMLFHAGFPTFSGGFVGVDVFFVVSGYLITTIILADLERGAFSLIHFYERRARRILPVLFLVVIACIPPAWLWLPPSELTSFSKSIVAVPLFVSNFFFWKDGGYFQTAAELKPLLHTWSLAVEEQYYVFFPMFMLIAWRYGRRFVLWSLLIIALISLAAAELGAVWRPVANFFLLPTRAWELAVGALVAFHLAKSPLHSPTLKLRQVLAILGFVLLLVSIFAYTDATPFPSVYGLLPTLGTALIILYASSETYVGRLLSVPILVGVGLISYSAYLWHQPILAFLRFFVSAPSLTLRGLVLVLILGLSILSWRFVETPFRQKGRFTRRFVFAGSATVSILLASFGFVSSRSDFSNEPYLAKQLAFSTAVYASNMNEREFVRSRIRYESLTPNTIVLGSSRIMQIGRHNDEDDVLNLAVSEASVEDLVAIGTAAVKRFNPNNVLVGVDPWLFNAKSGHNKWKTLETEYFSALSQLGMLEGNESASSAIDRLTPGAKLYRYINVAQVRAPNDSPSYMDKIRRDGSRVYNVSYAGRSQSEVARDVARDATKVANYAMSPYEFSEKSKEVFEKFIATLSGHRNVVLVLSPYHPVLFDFMKHQRPEFIDIERKFREVSSAYGIHIVGSYDPSIVGCDSGEFFDGMHPKDSCMKKVLSQPLLPSQ
ncbi:MAG TPA: acyltransferase [Longimicrobiales bacterium]|nr:acyltransferase [Longimicrobiales bacterium]